MTDDFQASLDWLQRWCCKGYRIAWSANSARLRDGANADCEICGCVVDRITGSFRSGLRPNEKLVRPWVICTDCLETEYT